MHAWRAHLDMRWLFVSSTVFCYPGMQTVLPHRQSCFGHSRNHSSYPPIYVCRRAILWNFSVYSLSPPAGYRSFSVLFKYTLWNIYIYIYIYIYNMCIFMYNSFIELLIQGLFLWKVENRMRRRRVIQCVTSHRTAIKAGQSVVCITPQNPYMPC